MDFEIKLKKNYVAADTNIVLKKEDSSKLKLSCPLKRISKEKQGILIENGVAEIPMIRGRAYNNPHQICEVSLLRAPISRLSFDEDDVIGPAFCLDPARTDFIGLPFIILNQEKFMLWRSQAYLPYIIDNKIRIQEANFMNFNSVDINCDIRRKTDYPNRINSRLFYKASSFNYILNFYFTYLAENKDKIDYLDNFICKDSGTYDLSSVDFLCMLSSSLLAIRVAGILLIFDEYYGVIYDEASSGELFVDYLHLFSEKIGTENFLIEIENNNLYSINHRTREKKLVIENVDDVVMSFDDETTEESNLNLLRVSSKERLYSTESQELEELLPFNNIFDGLELENLFFFAHSSMNIRNSSGTFSYVGNPDIDNSSLFNRFDGNFYNEDIDSLSYRNLRALRRTAIFVFEESPELFKCLVRIQYRAIIADLDDVEFDTGIQNFDTVYYVSSDLFSYTSQYKKFELPFFRFVKFNFGTDSEQVRSEFFSPRLLSRYEKDSQLLYVDLLSDENTYSFFPDSSAEYVNANPIKFSKRDNLYTSVHRRPITKSIPEYTIAEGYMQFFLDVIDGSQDTIYKISPERGVVSEFFGYSRDRIDTKYDSDTHFFIPADETCEKYKFRQENSEIWHFSSDLYNFKKIESAFIFNQLIFDNNYLRENVSYFCLNYFRNLAFGVDCFRGLFPINGVSEFGTYALDNG